MVYSDPINFIALTRDRNFCVDIVNLERLLSISNVGTLKSKDQCLVPSIKDIPAEYTYHGKS